MDLLEIREIKSACRERQKEFFATLNAEDRADAEARIASRLAAQSAWKDAGVILLYIALKSEIPLESIIAAARSAGKILALPQWNSASGLYVAAKLEPSGDNLVKGSFGVLEPSQGSAIIPWNRLDLALVPGVAFDLRGVRLGRGKGFYDRMLAQVQGTRCGVCFDAQLVPELPAEAHDIRMNCLLTPTRWIDFPAAGT